MEYMIKSYEDLRAWQSADKLLDLIYALTEKFPSSEVYVFVSQMRRAALSVPSNIAEGYHRSSRKEYRHFCQIAYGSANELKVQMMAAKRLSFLPADQFEETEKLLKQTLRLLYGLCISLK
jgi:four helix bundle protein